MNRKIPTRKCIGCGEFSSMTFWLGGWEATLTPQGLSYFDDKEKAVAASTSAEAIPTKPTRKEFDVFISHANADKSDKKNCTLIFLR